VFPCAYYLTLALPRYRHPIDPILMLLTTVAIAECLRYQSHSSSPPRIPRFGVSTSGMS
jgi:hypothetical protein